MNGDTGNARVFKKTCTSGKITLYLSKRDFLDHLTHVDAIDGIVFIDLDYVKQRKVYVQVLATFRYGIEDLDVLGISFRKELFLASAQVYPPVPFQFDELTPMQNRLLKKLGSSAFPFLIQLPHHSPTSVTLQPGADSGEKCGVDYELSCFVEEVTDIRRLRKDTVSLAIRKLTYSPDEKPGPPPFTEMTKEFRGAGSIYFSGTLDKEKYYHGETIAVNVVIHNQSSKKIKSVRVTALQVADVMLYNRAAYSCSVDEEESLDNCPILPNHRNWSKVFHLCPLLSNNRNKYGLALDGRLKQEDTNLASTTVIHNKQAKENLGIIVNYVVCVKLCMGFGTSDISMEIPFTLTHPQPLAETQEQDPFHQSSMSHSSTMNTIDFTNETDFIHLETREKQDQVGLLFDEKDDVNNC